MKQAKHFTEIGTDGRPLGAEAIELIFRELAAAEEEHPGWPDDAIYAVAILIEEAGEAMQAAIDLTWLDKGALRGVRNELIGKLRRELAQTGAMALRALIHLED